MTSLLCAVIDGAGRPHVFWEGLATLWVFSAAVSAMSLPNSKSSSGYQWLFRFTHLLAANLDRAGLFEEGVIGEGFRELERKGDQPADL